MIITKAPFRVSFVGGGSDMEEFYSSEPGAVLSVTINKYMYISSHKFFDTNKLRVKYARTETVENVDQLQHPIVREVLRQFRIDGALEVSSNGDVPSGTGLASSSAFTVALLCNLYARTGVFATKGKLAAEACDIEINRLHEPIGKQDQYACAYGGLNVLRFLSSGAVSVEPLHIRREIYKTLSDNLLMFYTGEQRNASTILAEQKKNTISPEKRAVLRRMVEFVDDAHSAIYSGDLTEFGRILHENWLLKKTLASRISNSLIDEAYETAMKNGALGGKLLGAGGGGFLLFYCEPQHQPRLRGALSSMREMRFKLENEGAKLVYAGDEYWQD